jgi:hypothetical protein
MSIRLLSKTVEGSNRIKAAVGADYDRLVSPTGQCDPDGACLQMGIPGNRVEQLWPITARGAVY